MLFIVEIATVISMNRNMGLIISTLAIILLVVAINKTTLYKILGTIFLETDEKKIRRKSIVMLAFIILVLNFVPLMVEKYLNSEIYTQRVKKELDISAEDLAEYALNEQITKNINSSNVGVVSSLLVYEDIQKENINRLRKYTDPKGKNNRVKLVNEKRKAFY